MISPRKSLSAIARRLRNVSRGWTRSNCIIFSLSLFFHRWLKGRRERRLWGVVPPESYLVIRLSRTPLAMVHFMYGEMDAATGQIKVVSYKPAAGEKGGASVLFRGRVQRGDPRPAHLPRGTARWLAWMRAEAKSGGFGMFPIRATDGNQVVIFDDDVNACSSSDELYEFIQRRRNEILSGDRFKPVVHSQQVGRFDV